MARVRDVIDDEEWKISPLSLLLGCAAGILSAMIIVNALGHHKQQAVATSENGAPQAGATAGQASTTVVLKYDPLIEDVQRELLAVGIYKGPVDGVNGLRTKQAIQAYQQANGLPASGEASDDLISHIRFTRKVQQAAEFTGSVAGQDETVANTGVAASVAPAPLPKTAAAPAQDNSVKKAQVALAGLGYDISKLDGQVNDETRAAILKYEMDNGLDMNGTVDSALLKALKVH